MRLAEPNPDLRGILVTVRDEDGELATDAAAGLAAGDVKVTINGAAPVNAGGTFEHVGGGLYRYEATEAEVAVAGFLGVFFLRAGYRVEFAWDSVGDIWSIGEVDPTLLRFPFTVYDIDGELAAGVDLDDVLETSLNGGAFGAAAGTGVEIAHGVYYYQGVAAEADTEGAVALKVTPDGDYRTTHAWIGVSDPTAGLDDEPPTVTVISPTPGVAPGDPGGFPADPDEASVTPIVLEVVDDAGIAYIALFARFGGETRTPIFRRGAFEQGYSLFSYVEVIDEETTRLHVRADAGWQSMEITFDADVVDAGGNLT